MADITLANGVIHLAEKASPKVVEAFNKESCTEGLFSNDYDWTGVRTVKVYSVDDLPLNDYNATLVDGNSRFGALTELGDTVQEMTITQDKSFNGIIDKSNNTSTLMIKEAGKVLNRQMKNVVIPYIDKFRLNAMANWSDTVGSDTFTPLRKTISANDMTRGNILETIMKANAQMSNELVPDTNRVLYIGYTDAILVKLADQVVGIDKLGEKTIVNGVIGKVDKCQIRIVPDSYMPKLGTGNDAPTVRFMIVEKGVALAPKKIETYRVITNSYIVDGSIVQGRLMHDVFVLNKKVAGILVAA